MIRHIVMWKLKAEESEAKALAAAEIAEALEGLASVIPQLRSIKVSTNMAYFEKNWDVVLVADYASLEDLDAYQVHPEHVRVGGIIVERVSARASVDFEL